MADKVQQYTLGDRIGTGGTGIVRRARNAEDKTEAAMKTLQTDIARDPATRKRLLASRKQLQSVPPHENLARVLDVLEQGDTLHVLMEYAPGKSLENSLGRKSRPMNAENAVGILNQVLRGAVAAHSKGVLHGNLKPSDIILSNAGTEPFAKVSGFGIAKNFSNSAILRAAGRAQTLPYLAPEQVRGETGDERTDVYSVGMMLYRMMTGTLPYASSERGAEARIRHAILNEPLPDIAETLPDLNVSPHILSIIRRATAKDRRERIPTMREFSRLLQKVQTELPAKTVVATSIATTAAASIGAVAGATALGAASTLSAQAAPKAPAAMQFPPQPSTPIEQEVTFMQPVRSLSTPTPLPELPKTQENAQSAAASSEQQATAPASAQEQDDPKEKSFWNILTNPGNITTPAAAGAPTLVKSEAQLEVERRMQALRASQAASAAAATQATSAQEESQPFASSPQAASNLASQTLSSAPQTFSSAPQTPQYEAAKPSVAGSPTSQYQGAKPQEEKKKRSLMPWLVVGAIALGGGIYYVALKNKGTSGVGTGTGSEATSQQALSKEEIERQYDSLQAGKANDKAPASETKSASEEQQPATPVTEQPSAQEQPSTQEQSPQAQSSQQAQPSTEVTKPTTTVAEKPSSASSSSAANTPTTTAAPSNETASKTSPKNKNTSGVAATPSPKKSITTSVKEGVNEDASAIAAKLRANSTKSTPSDKTPTEKSSEKRTETSSKVVASKAAPQGTSENTSAQNTSEGKARPKALANLNVPSQRSLETSSKIPSEKSSKQSRKKASSETPFSTSNDATSTATPKEASAKETSAKESSSKEKVNAKSGSLASYNAAQDGEREAVRAKIRNKYSSHLSKKQSSGTGGKTSAANTIAANTPTNAASTSSNDGKSIPAALRNSNKTSPKTNREDNYAPPTNPVDATNETDAATVALEAASRKALGAEPYLILRGHVAGVRSVSFSPDGKLLASGADDKTVKIWDAATGTILRSLRGHGNSVTSVFFSPDSKFVISSGKDKTVRIWDVETGNAIQRSPGVSCEGSPAAFSPDGSFIATANNRNINISKVQK